MILRLGTRGSQLALAQTTLVASALRAAWSRVETEIVIIQTRGDRALDAPLPTLGGKGAFTAEIEAALLEGRIDVAVHSLKDLPSAIPEGLALGPSPRRESARDLLITREPVLLDALPEGLVVGAASIRRQAQLLRRYPNIEMREIRGNVPTRLRKLAERQFDALVLAEAGINRLGLRPAHFHVLDDALMLPSPGQGALGIQYRAGDGAVRTLLDLIADEDTTACVAAERALLAALGGNCQLPLGGYAQLLPTGGLLLKARVLSPDGGIVIETEQEAPKAEATQLGRLVAGDLLQRGGAALLAGLWQPSPVLSLPPQPFRERRVVVTRDEDADGPLSRELRARGLTPVCLPLIRPQALEDLSSLRAALGAGEKYDGLVVTSTFSLEVLSAAIPNAAGLLAGVPVWCVGPATAAKARELGLGPVVNCGGGRDALLARLAKEGDGSGRRLLYLRGERAPQIVAQGLRDLGYSTEEVVVYTTESIERNRGLLLALLENGEVEAITLCSESAAESLADVIGAKSPKIPLYSIGSSTTDSIRRLFQVEAIQADLPTFASLAQCIDKH